MKKILLSSVTAILLFAGCNGKKANNENSGKDSPCSTIETSMRALPPLPDDMEDLKIKDRNILKVLVSKKGQIMVGLGDEPYSEIALDDLKDKAKNFILNVDNDDKLPEKKDTDFKLSNGTTWTYPVSLGIISLQCNKSTPYELYLQVQNELTRAFNEIRDEVSMKTFGQEFKELEPNHSEIISKAIPMKISEAEPRE